MAKLTLYDPEGRDEPVNIERVTYKRRGGDEGSGKVLVRKGVVGKLRGAVGAYEDEHFEDDGGGGVEEEYEDDWGEKEEKDGETDGSMPVVSAPPVVSRPPIMLTPDVLKEGKGKLKGAGDDNAKSEEEGVGIGMGGLSPMRPPNPFKVRSLPRGERGGNGEVLKGGAAARRRRNVLTKQNPLSPQLNPADLKSGKSSLKSSPLTLTVGGGDMGNDRYLPKSPLNLNSSILKDALKKGKAKLKGGRGFDVKEDHDVEEEGGGRKRRFSLTKESSLASVKREEVAEVKSRHILESMMATAKKEGYFMASKDVICPRDGRVYGRGRFGSVMGGLIKSGRKAKKKKEVVSRRSKVSKEETTGSSGGRRGGALSGGVSIF